MLVIRKWSRSQLVVCTNFSISFLARILHKIITKSPGQKEEKQKSFRLEPGWSWWGLISTQFCNVLQETSERTGDGPMKHLIACLQAHPCYSSNSPSTDPTHRHHERLIGICWQHLYSGIPLPARGPSVRIRSSLLCKRVVCSVTRLAVPGTTNQETSL